MQSVVDKLDVFNKVQLWNCELQKAISCRRGVMENYLDDISNWCSLILSFDTPTDTIGD